MKPIKTTKEISSRKVIKPARYKDNVLLDPVYKDETHSIDVWHVQDGEEVHEFLSEEDAKAFCK